MLLLACGGVGGGCSRIQEDDAKEKCRSKIHESSTTCTTTFIYGADASSSSCQVEQ